MSKQTRYLLTVDSDTGVAVKLERLGEAGDLTEVPLGQLSGVAPAPPGAPAGAASPQSLVINIYMGGTSLASPPRIAVHEPSGPGARLSGPGSIGAPTDGRWVSAPPTGPGGPAGGERPGGDGGSE